MFSFFNQRSVGETDPSSEPQKRQVTCVWKRRIDPLSDAFALLFILQLVYVLPPGLANAIWLSRSVTHCLRVYSSISGTIRSRQWLD